MLGLVDANPTANQIERRRSWTRRLWFDESLPAGIANALVSGDVDSMLSAAEPLQVKDRCIVARLEDSGQRFLLKRHIWGGPSRTLRMLHRQPAARRNSQLANRIRELGIPTPRPVACLEHCFGPLGYRSYLLTEYIEGESLWQGIRHGRYRRDDYDSIAEQVAQLWERLLQAGVSHNDLKPENLLVDPHRKVWLIDLEKVALKSSGQKLARKHAEDASRFLHVRNWHPQPEIAEVFRSALRQTMLSDVVTTHGGHDHPLFREGFSSAELESRLSVAIVSSSSQRDDLLLETTIDSVADLSDEIAIVGPDAKQGRFEVLEWVAGGDESAESISAPQLLHTSSDVDVSLRHPWVLVLSEGEAATPDLVRQLPEEIVAARDTDAFAVGSDEFLFGRPTGRRCVASEPVVRVFRQDRCRFTLDGGQLSVDVEPTRIASTRSHLRRYLATGMADYVSQLNHESTAIATRQYAEHRRPFVVRAAANCVGEFFRQYLGHRAFRGGRVGLQFALLEAFKQWLTEAKLRQFRSSDRALHEPVERPPWSVIGSTLATTGAANDDLAVAPSTRKAA